MYHTSCAIIAALVSSFLAISFNQYGSDPADLAPPSPQPQRRVLFVTLEFADPIFSGNGVLSRTMAKSLLALGSEVLVVCGSPDAMASSSMPFEHRHATGTARVAPVLVPAGKWLRLDRHSAWQEFSSGVGELRNQIEAFNATLVMAVDWSGWLALQHIADLLREKPAVYLNFRVFSRSAELLRSASDRRFYAARECRALLDASAVVALSLFDMLHLRRSLRESCSPSDGDVTCAAAAATASPCPVTTARPFRRRSEDGLPAFAVLRPPVRGDVLRLGRRHWRRHATAHRHRSSGAAVVWSRRRRFLTCCVRLSPEKNAMLFADLAVELAAFLRARDISVRLCGAAADQSYASAVKARLMSAGLHVDIWEDFTSAEKLMDAFETSLLNIHPSLHDAFGMTVVEAATVATPSLIHDNAAVGVGEVFTAAEVFRTNLSASIPQIALTLRRLIANRIHLAHVGHHVQRRALTFDLSAYQQQLFSVMTSLSSF